MIQLLLMATDLLVIPIKSLAAHGLTRSITLLMHVKADQEILTVRNHTAFFDIAE
jgi:hypothetical protein